MHARLLREEEYTGDPAGICQGALQTTREKASALERKSTPMVNRANEKRNSEKQGASGSTFWHPLFIFIYFAPIACTVLPNPSMLKQPHFPLFLSSAFSLLQQGF